MSQTANPATEIPAESSLKAQLDSLLHHAGFYPLDRTGWIRVTGEDRVRWLNGMVTNSVQSLETGQGCYNFFLNAQGRIQGDATIFAEPDGMLIETGAAFVPGLMAMLDRFIIMDDVELTDISSTRKGLALGPDAASILATINLSVADLQPLAFKTAAWNAAEITILRAASPLVPQYELWANDTTISTLIAALQSARAVACSPETVEWLRILSGTPLYGTDIRDRDLPQETGQTQALHFSKGCYLGQEIVERIRSRGNVHRAFTAFRIEGALPAPGAALEVDGKPAGELTSVAAIPLHASMESPLQLALGYGRREALERRAPLLFAGGIAHPIASPFSFETTTASSASKPEVRP